MKKYKLLYDAVEVFVIVAAISVGVAVGFAAYFYIVKYA